MSGTGSPARRIRPREAAAAPDPTAVLAVLALFQLALAFGAPWGRFAWGGQHPGVLPTGYRIGSPRRRSRSCSRCSPS